MNPDYGQPNHTKRLVVWSIVLITLFIAGGMYWTYSSRYKTVTLQASTGTKIEIGAEVTGVSHESGESGPEDVLLTTTGIDTIRLKVGTYAVRFSGPDYQEQTTTITVPETTSIKTPDLDFSKTKLTSTLQIQRTALHDVVYSKLPKSKYTITYEAVYKRGDYYGAVLNPIDPAIDIQRIILQKKNNSWVVVAPPSIVFFLGDFPAIPAVAIRDVNNKP